jgi:GNAT superfamily N-acetyltransferase
VTRQTGVSATIRPVDPGEGERLRGIAIAAKAHWDYDLDFVTRWAARGDWSRKALAGKEVYVVETHGEAVAWAALVSKNGVWWLDDLWVLPEWMGKGIGTRLFRHIADRARALGGPTRLEWQAEPNAVGFYEKVGGRYLRDGEPTSWGRVLPVMGIDLGEER